MSFSIQNSARKNILALKPYSSARDEFKGTASVYLDANENPFYNSFNRYPDPLQGKIKDRLSVLKKVAPEQIFLGNGSDEAIDLLIRCFCEPNRDSILITEPTYGMYAVCANTNAVSIKTVSLTSEFQIDINNTLDAIDDTVKIIFLCSPNNPSGNLLNREAISSILSSFNGLVVVDEAYLDFTNERSWTAKLGTHSNLVVLQTLSKAWGLAGLRLGMCFAHPDIVNLLNKLKYPYNINSQTQLLVLEALQYEEIKEKQVATILEEKRKLAKALGEIAVVEKVFPSDANFLLVKVQNAKLIYHTLMELGIIVRDRSSVVRCEECLRITIGTPNENEKLINELRKL